MQLVLLALNLGMRLQWPLAVAMVAPVGAVAAAAGSTDAFQGIASLELWWGCSLV